MPTLALLGFVFVFPLLWALALSFTRFSATKPAPPVWIGLGNEGKLLTDPAVWAAFVTTAQFVLMAVSIELVLGLGLALLRRGAFSGHGVLTPVLRPMMIVPARLR